MAAPIEFYFDFSSPFGYLASEKIDQLAAKHGREVMWRPFLLGAVFKITGGMPTMEVPIKGDYYKRDFPRSARYLGVAYRSRPHSRSMRWRRRAPFTGSMRRTRLAPGGSRRRCTEPISWTTSTSPVPRTR